METIKMKNQTENIKNITIITIKLSITFLFIAWNFNVVGQETINTETGSLNKIDMISMNKYRFNGGNLNNKEIFDYMNTKNNQEINLHIKKARIAKGAKLIGLMSIPAFALGTLFLAPVYADAMPGFTGAIPLIALRELTGGTTDQNNIAIAGAFMATGAVCLTTSIIIGSNQKKHTHEAIELYNEQY